MSTKEENFTTVPAIVRFEGIPHEGKTDQLTIATVAKQENSEKPEQSEIVLAVRQESLKTTMETRFQTRTLPQIQYAIYVEQEKDHVNNVRVLAGLQQRLFQAAEQLKQNPDLLNAIRDSAIAHETVHARLEAANPAYKALLERHGSKLNSEYLPRRDFRQAVFTQQSLEEMRSYASQLELLSESEDNASTQAILDSFVLDKAAYPFLPGFERTFHNCQNGRIESIETNIFGCLALITKNPGLTAQIQAGEVNIDGLKSSIIGALEDALEAPSNFIEERTSAEFLDGIEVMGQEYLELALNEAERLNGEGEL